MPARGLGELLRWAGRVHGALGNVRKLHRRSFSPSALGGTDVLGV